WLRLVIVTPDMHKVHHSDWRSETDSNYSTVLSGWDRLFGSLQLRSDPKSLVFGLREFTDPECQAWWGMMKTPFVRQPTNAAAPPCEALGPADWCEAHQPEVRATNCGVGAVRSVAGKE